MPSAFKPAIDARSCRLCRQDERDSWTYRCTQLKEEAVKQRYIQSFLMVSAAFFAMNAPIRVGGLAGSEATISGIPRISQVRVEQVSNKQAPNDKDDSDA
jgi:hypothetical protein